MIGGLMKTTSRFALAAAAGLFLGAYAFTPAYAADLGGDCCADLEERVAELEATTARKGNRVVSLQIYGHVNQALLIWDDGFDSDAYIVDNDWSMTRLGVRGSAMMKPGWTAGYNIELGVRGSAPSGSVSQGVDDPAGVNNIIIRQSRVYIESAQLGRVTIGQQSTATDGITEISLGSGVGVDSQVGIYNNGFFLRGPDGENLGIKWGNLVDNLDGPRDNTVRYDSPSIYGFIFSAAWGDDDFWDLSLRFSKEWNSIRVAAGIGYQEDRRSSIAADTLSGSFSLMHTPSGIFGTVAAGETQRSGISGLSLLLDCPGTTGFALDGLCFTTQIVDLVPNVVIAGLEQDDVDFESSIRDAHFWNVQLGIQRNFTGLGATTIAGLYGYYDDFASGFFFFNSTDEVNYVVTGSQVDRWQFVLNQRFDSAALDLYLNVDYYDANLRARNILEFLGEDEEIIDFEFADETSKINSDWWGVVTGIRMQF
jgi:hypothetical protein